MVKDNISKVREEISSVCEGIGRDANKITIVAVSKERSIEDIKEAIESGISDIGENKVQEALVKYGEFRIKGFSSLAAKWHMVGHLQTNKAKEAVKIFDLIHSVDSVGLAVEINKQAAKIGKVQDILIEVKVSPEITKFGFQPQEVFLAVKEISGLKNINMLGLMTIAPIGDEQEKSRPYFRALREIRDKINKDWALSMGMSDDFKVAIEEGSTMVRLGRAIFEG